MSKHGQQQQIHTTTSTKQHIININTTAYPKIVKSKRCLGGRWRTKKVGVEGVEGESFWSVLRIGGRQVTVLCFPDLAVFLVGRK